MTHISAAKIQRRSAFHIAARIVAARRIGAHVLAVRLMPDESCDAELEINVSGLRRDARLIILMAGPAGETLAGRRKRLPDARERAACREESQAIALSLADGDVGQAAQLLQQAGEYVRSFLARADVRAEIEEEAARLQTGRRADA